MIKRFLRRLTRLSLVGAAVGAVVYFFDPRSGKGRRSQAKDQLQAKVRRAGDQADATATHVENKVEGLVEKASQRGGEPPDDDKTLVDKIKSEVLGKTEYVGSDVVVDAVNGVVTLRGQLERAEKIDDLAAAVAAVPGVSRVENFLHPPDTPAPNKQDSLET
jgi:hyperosmotically inducible periplasmic protein